MLNPPTLPPAAWPTASGRCCAAEQLLNIDAANGLRADGSCATHAHCDANMAMLEAVVGLTGLDEGEASDRLERGGALLDGWILARIEGFSARG